MEAEISGAFVALLPVKDFAQAKSRLGPRLSSAQRTVFAEALAHHSYQELNRFTTTFISTESPQVVEWAVSHSYRFIHTSAIGLNPVLEEARARVRAAGAAGVVVAPSDLTSYQGIERHLALLSQSPITISPDHSRSGTNVLGLNAESTIRFHFGDHSFEAHLRECADARVSAHIVEAQGLAFDIDVFEDLRRIARSEIAIADPKITDAVRVLMSAEEPAS
ncbi:MAG: 2-phospho-L-lactate guanylyltransferase [Acidimicrobiales bacterium]